MSYVFITKTLENGKQIKAELTDYVLAILDEMDIPTRERVIITAGNRAAKRPLSDPANPKSTW